ncbi:MAG: hypothetical protein BWK80_33185 [Desulfobacteraceae bacterium IS3]|nr:MAG: hypothetical protein BWK80_33185 [Desulfobacteraceae bacterium IS3]
MKCAPEKFSQRRRERKEKVVRSICNTAVYFQTVLCIQSVLRLSDGQPVQNIRIAVRSLIVMNKRAENTDIIRLVMSGKKSES